MWIYVLLWTLIGLQGAQNGTSAAVPPVRSLVLKPVSFARNFQGLRQRKDYAWWDMRPMAIAPSSAQVAFGGFAQREDGTRVGQVWLTSFSDTPAAMLTEEPGATVTEIHWSPEGSSLAYITRDQAKGPSDFDCSIKVIDLRTGHKTTVPSFGATAPLWSRDSKSLFFWQVSDDPKERTGMRPYATTWRVYRFDLASMHLQKISNLTFDAQGALSPDGSSAGGMVEGTPAIEFLQTHHVDRYALPGGFRSADAMSWSADSQWFTMRVSDSYGLSHNEAIQAATGKRVDLIKAVAAGLRNTQEIYNSIGMVNWFPEKPHLLLLEARLANPAALTPDLGITARRWLLYDLDTESTQRLTGLDLKGGDIVISPSLRWSVDRQFALSREDVLRLEPSPTTTPTSRKPEGRN